MSGQFEWKVLRGHEGDRFYGEGETRIGSVADLGHLSPRTLQRLGPVAAAKSEAKPHNKAERPLANKAETGRKAK